MPAKIDASGHSAIVIRRITGVSKSDSHYLRFARVFAVASIVLAAVSTLFVDKIDQYIKLAFNLLCFLGIPIYAAVLWRRATRAGMWWAFGLGIGSYVT